MNIARYFAALALAAASTAAFAAADCHVGIVGGVATGSTRHVDQFNGDLTGKVNVNGGMGGGTAGCRWPLGGGWLGFEGDYMTSNVKGSINEPPPNVGINAETRVDSLATLRAEFGGEFAPRWYAFASFGMATAPTKVNVCNALGTCSSDKETMVGWAGGLSARYAFSQALRLRLEYLYAGFQDKQFSPGGVALNRNVELSFSVMRIGLDLHF